ncbi:DCL family protein [Sphingomonas arvum]|uniref:DCL family protein n=1 Tax=Sphingomonas arvum TaxID=2992113 RepID=UPI0038B34235
MLSRYKVGDEVSPEDSADLGALLKRHDEAADKIGVGVQRYEVGSAPEPFPNQRCFWIVRKDGSRIDFSYQHCLEKKAYD